MLKLRVVFLGLLLAFAGSRIASAAPPAPPPPLEAYGRLPAMDDVAVSPGAKTIAYVADTAGKRTLTIQSADGTVLFKIGVDGQKVRELRFFDETHLLIMTSTTAKLDGYAARYEWMTARSLNFQKRTLATLLGVSAHASTNTVFSVNIMTVNGHDVLLAQGLISKGEDIAYFSVDPDTGRSEVFSRHFGVFDDHAQSVAWPEFYSGADRWRLIAAAPKGPGVKELFAKEAAHIDTPDLLGYGRDKGKVLVSTIEDDQRIVYEITIADGSKTRVEFKGDGAVSPIYDERSQALLGFSYEGEASTDYELYDPALKVMWAAVRAKFPGATVAMPSITPDRNAAIILVQTGSDAGSYYLVDMAKGSMDRVGRLYPDVPDAAVGEKRLIHYKAADGLDIPAFLTLPPGREAKNLPLIVMPHGGPQSRDDPGFDWWAQAMASRGYAVLQPQFRGSTGFGLTFQRAGYGEWGRKMQTDLSDGVRALAARGIADPKRVCIVGASYGGYAAMAGPALDPGVYRCAVAYAGVSDLRKMLAQEKRDSGGGDTPSVRFWKRYMGAQSINDGALEAISPAQQAARFDAPILLIHGKDDTVVGFDQSQTLADALKRAGKPVEFISLAGEDHWLSNGETRLTMLRACIDFLLKNNPPD